MKKSPLFIALALTAAVGCGKEKKKDGEAAAKPTEITASGDNTTAKIGLDTGGKALGGEAVKLNLLKFGGSGFEGQFNEALDSWTFEKWEAQADESNEDVVTIYVDSWDVEEWPTDVEGFAAKLAEDDFLDAGYNWPKIESKTADDSGWTIIGESSDGDETEVSFAVQVAKYKILCRGSVSPKAKDVKATLNESIAACKAATIP